MRKTVESGKWKVESGKSKPLITHHLSLITEGVYGSN